MGFFEYSNKRCNNDMFIYLVTIYLGTWLEKMVQYNILQL